MLFPEFFVYWRKLRHRFFFFHIFEVHLLLSGLGDLSETDKAFLSEKYKILSCTPELNQKSQKLKCYFKDKIAQANFWKHQKASRLITAFSKSFPVQDSRQHHRPRCPWRLVGIERFGESTDSLGAVWSWAHTSTCTPLAVTKNFYTTHDETRATAKPHHQHHLTKLSNDHQHLFA